MKRDVCIHGIECTVDFDYSPGCRGARERGTGFQLEPDEPESVEINEIFVSDQEVSSLFKEDIIREIEGEIMMLLSEESANEEAAYEDRLEDILRDEEE